MSKAKIYYHDIGDYLSREEKLSIIQKFGSIENMEDQWQVLQPNEHGDWLNQRDDVFGEYIPIAPKDKLDAKAQSYFIINSLGVNSNRDVWVYNYSSRIVAENMQRTINFFNSQGCNSICRF
jgi:predicted helicase